MAKSTKKNSLHRGDSKLIMKVPATGNHPVGRIVAFLSRLKLVMVPNHGAE